MAIQAFFFYQVEDKAFERAARTEAGPDDPQVVRMFLSVKTKADFLAAWKKISDDAIAANTKVDIVSLFLHASKDGGDGDGFEFASLGGQSGTLIRDEMTELVRLPWLDGSDVRLRLFGCNTGVRGERGWCPAEHLAQTQLVACRGESGFSYFSRKLETYEAQVPNDTAIYLHAYKRAQNGALGDGGRMSTHAFDPYVKQPVGVNCPNAALDVKAVQQLLNDVSSDKGGPDPKLVEDGAIGPKTISAIKKFQQTQLGFEDGIVDPGKRTLIKLLEFKGS